MIILFLIILSIPTYQRQSPWNNFSRIADCSILDATQTTILTFEEPSQVFEMTQGDTFLKNFQILINFGIWMKWQPYSLRKDTVMYMQCQDQFLYSLERKIEKKTLFLLYYTKTLNRGENQFKLGLKSHYFQSNEQATFDYVDIEGAWLLFKFFYDMKKKEISFTFYHYELKVKQEIKIEVNLPFTETLIHKIGGIEEEIVFDGQKICYSQFFGRLSTVFSFQSEKDLEDFIDDCYRILDDCKGSKKILVQSYQLKGMEFLSFQTLKIEKNIYSIYGWFQMDYDVKITEKQSLLRIANDFNENFKRSHNCIELQFQINYENRQAEIYFKALQYDIQSGIPSLFDKSLELSNYFLAFQQWHFIRIEIGSKAVLRLFSSLLPEEIYIELQTKSYTGMINFISVGGNPSGNFHYYGQVQDLVFESYCKVNEQKFISKCHYSCVECRGPSKEDCISCEVKNYRFLFNNQCDCQQQTFDVGQSQCFDIADYQGKIVESELECKKNGYDICQGDKQIQCSFGHFNYKNNCIQCPYYDEEKSVKYIECLNCLLFPDNFSITLQCYEDAYTFGFDQQNTYNIKKREENFLSYFEIILMKDGMFNLQNILNQKINNLTICNRGYYLFKNECFLCQNGCDQCDDFIKCILCKYGFYLNENKNCVKCDQGCETCDMIKDSQICLTCENEFYLNQNKICQPCGQYCADCNRNGFCNYCKNPSKFFISLDGINCLPCNIEGCSFCYQLLGNTVSSFQINQRKVILSTLSESEKQIYCSKCDDWLVLNIQNNKCDESSTSEICLFGYEVNQHFKCQSNDFQIPLDGCTNFQNCHLCSKNQCIECIKGYFLDQFFGTCQKCQDSCEMCIQQHKIYQDSWKQKVFPYFLYLESIGQITSLFDGIINFTQREDYVIICTQCQSGFIRYDNQCIQGCSDDCEVCEIIEFKAVCIKCKSFQGKQIRSLNSEGQCLQCPDNCAACYEVVPDAFNQKNKDLEVSEKNVKYLRKCFQTQKIEKGFIYLNSNFQSAIQCQNYQKCTQNVIFEWNLKCSPEIQNKNPIDRFYNIDEFFNKNIFQEIEKQELYMFFNELTVQQIEFMIYLVSDDQTICQFPSNVSFISFFKKNIFSLLQIKLKIVGKNQITKLSETFITINGFNQIEFINLQFQSTILQLENEFESSVCFIDCIIQPHKDDQLKLNFHLISNQNYNLFIENLEIKNCIIEDLNIFIFEVKDYSLIPLITIINLQIIESKFINTNFLYIKTEIKSKNLHLKLDKLLFQKSNLHNSTLINSSGSQIITALLSNFKINQFSLTESSFLTLKNSFQFNFKIGEIINGSFNDSNFIFANQFEGINIQFEDLDINNSSLFNNNFTSFESITLFQTIQFKLENVKVANSTYNIRSSILQIVSKENEIIIVNLTKFKIMSTRLHLKQEEYDFILQSIIQLECQICFLDQIEIIRDFGLPEITILNSEKLFITNSIFTQNQLQIKKMLHTNIDCYSLYQQKLMQYFILIQQYQNITIDNLIINSTFTFNNPIILINGQESLSKWQQRKIKVSNSQFLENLIVTSSQDSQASIISISSSQNCEIIFNNLIFSGNHLNSIEEEIQMEISTALLVFVMKANVVIANCKFFQNLITNSSSSIINIQAIQIEITNSTFEKTNILNFEKLAKNIILDTHIVTTSQLSKAFPIKSLGGCGKFYAQNITIDNIFVNQSSSACGGTFYIKTQNNAIISITNSNFESSSTIQDQIITTFGGLFYIDSQFYQLNFSMINCSIEKSFSRLYGGSIYLNASSTFNYMIFKNLNIRNTFSQSGTFLYYYSLFGKSFTNIYLEEINYSHSQNCFYQFLSNLNKFTYYEAYQIFLSSSIFFLNNVNFTMKSSQFLADHNLNIAYINDLNELYLIDIYIGYSSFSSTIILVLFKQYYNGIAILQNITVENVIETQYIYNNEECIKIDDNVPFNFICEIETKDSQNIQIEDNLIQIFKNQLICNLNVSNFYYLQIPSIITFFQFYELNQFLATNINIKQIVCQNCQYGFISISQIYQKSQNNIIFKEVNIYDSICGNQACISILSELSKDSIILYQNLLYNRRLSQSFDSIILQKSLQFQAVFTNCNFYKNQGIFGGGILIAGINTLIQYTTFVNNKASIGGAVYTVSLDSNTYFYKCQFILNTAQIAGGIFLAEQPIQYGNNSQNLILDNNSTNYGDNLVEIPISLALSFNEGNIILQNYVISSTPISIIEYAIIKPYKILGKNEYVQTLFYPSGQQIGSYLYIIPNQFQNINLNLTFRIIAQNSFKEKQNILQDSNCTLSIKVINQTSQQEMLEYEASLSYYTMKFSSNTGDYNLDDLIIEFNPYYADEIVLRIFITSDAIKIPQYNTQPPYLREYYITNYTLFVDVKTFPCQAGEFFNSTNGACYQCDIAQFQYQVKQNSTICEFKDEEKIDSLTSSMIQLKQSYWRPFYFSQVIEKCAHLVGNCLGGWIAGDTSCFIGHIGALCEQCDLYNTRGDGEYSVSSAFKCGSCDQISLISIFLSVNSQNITNQKFKAAKRLRMLGVKCILKDPSIAVLIKIFTNYIQIISTLQTFQLQIPNELINFFQVLGTPLEQMAYSLDCFLISITDISIIYFRVIWSLNMAFIYVCVFFLILYFIIKMKLLIYDITYISSALIYIFIFLQPNIIKEIISLASFRTISEVNWIQSNVAYQYDTQNHQNWLKYLCLPVFIVLAIIIPFFLYFNILKSRKQLEDIQTRKVWGYLYSEYKFEAYYWEFIKLFQKDFIVIVLAYYDDYIPIKASLVFLCIFTYSLISTYESPYLIGELNKLDIQSITVCAVSIILGSSIYLAQQNDLEEVIWSFYIVITILNFILFIKLVIQIALAYFEKIYEAIEKFKEILLSQQKADSKYYPFLKKLFESSKTRKQRVKERFAKIKQFLIYEAKQIIKQKQNYLMMTERISHHQRYSLIQQKIDQTNSNQKNILKIQFL